MTARRLIALLSALFLLPLMAATTQAAQASPASPAPSADDGALFAPMSDFTLGKSPNVRVRPADYRAYRVDLAGLRAQLGSGGKATLAIPDPAGTLTTFDVVEDSVMEADLQAAHPEIRTYSGADANGSSIRLDVTPMGFHAFVRQPDGVTWFVDPAYNGRDEDRVLSYAGGSTRSSSTFVEHELDHVVDSVVPATDGADFSTPGGLVSQRTFRMAFVTDPTYATYFGTGNVLFEKATLMNRVNEVYNDDLAIKFVLVSGTDNLNLDTAAKATGPNGPCGANPCFTASQLSGCGGSTLNRNNIVTGLIIGAENFDIGHIGLGVNGGGIAGLGVVGTSDKAAGCTGLPEPDGDVYAIDYVAHEVGHQMGGNHTFNGNQVNCAGGNRNGPTSVEPGSGSSVMAYAGICGTDNLQPHSDPYFSQRSVDEINATTAASPGNNNERQMVAFKGLDVGEQVVLSCAACGSQTVTFTGNSVTDAAAFVAAVSAVTGAVATVTGYDGSGTVNANGFTANWAGAADRKTLTATPNGGSSFTAIVGTIINGGPETNQGTVSVSTNHSPTVTGPTDKTIPARTPFELTGSAADADGDSLTYMWEQNDAGILATALTNNTKVTGPLFRQFGTAAIVSDEDSLLYHSPGENLAGTSPTRTFPDLAQIAAGNTNAATGSCPVAPPAGQTTTDCFSEFLPTSAYLGAASSRQLHFRLTARDEFSADGPADHPGGLSADDVTLTLDPLTGPFLVTSRATAGAPATGGGSESVTWDVADTNTASLATNVKISLSTDGGLTYPTVLSASTPNDGSESVTLPDLQTTTARIKVEAVGNYFFDINDANFTITGTNVAPTVNAGPDATVIVNQQFTSSGSFTDDLPSTATATVDYGDGSGVQALPLTGTTFTLSHAYTTVGAKTVTVTVTDAGALFATDTATVTVNPNAAPTVNAGPDAAAVTGELFTSAGSFTDELPDLASATVDYGDGSGVQSLALSGSTFSLSHTYATVGAKTVTVTVTDSGGLFASDTATVTVNAVNVAPTVNAGPDATVAVGAAFTSSGSFIDEAPGTASATVDYGDGAGPQALVLTGSTFALSHTYTTAGPKTVMVRVTDAGARIGTDTATVTVTGGSTPSTVKASAKPKQITQGRPFKVKATVTIASGVPAGTVQVYKGSKLLGTGTLKSNGKVTIKISQKKAKKLKIGKNKLTAKYLGSATVAASQDAFVIKVKKKN